MQIPPALKGPLGSHSGYIKHIAIQNVSAHYWAKKKHEEDTNTSNQAKYEELRLFLNAIESFNNILDYFYFEHEDQLNARYATVIAFRKAVHEKYDALNKLADLANAYKHCIRTSGNKKNAELPQAQDLQRPALNILFDLSNQNFPEVAVDYSFDWPILEHEKILSDAVDFWAANYYPILLDA